MPTPRLRLLPNAELPPAWTEQLGAEEQNDILRLFGHNSELFSAWNGFYKHIMRDGTVPMRIKEMMRLRIARLNECAV